MLMVKSHLWLLHPHCCQIKPNVNLLTLLKFCGCPPVNSPAPSISPFGDTWPNEYVFFLTWSCCIDAKYMPKMTRFKIQTKKHALLNCFTRNVLKHISGDLSPPVAL